MDRLPRPVRLIAVVVLSLAVVVWAVRTVLLPAVGIVDEHWPDGLTRDFRARAEKTFPPPAGAEFVDARRVGELGYPYRECVYYQSPPPREEIIAHYKALVDSYGWIDHGPPSPAILTATDGSGSAGTPVTSTGNDGASTTVFEGARPTRASMSVMASNSSERGYSYYVCSPSWENVEKSLSDRAR